MPDVPVEESPHDRTLEAQEFSDLPDAPIAFGLRAQGHIPTVERMLQNGASWDEIGKEIGWHGPTAQEFYERTSSHERPLDGWCVAICPGCGTQIAEWLDEDGGPGHVEEELCPMCAEADRE